MPTVRRLTLATVATQNAGEKNRDELASLRPKTGSRRQALLRRLRHDYSVAACERTIQLNERLPIQK